MLYFLSSTPIVFFMLAPLLVLAIFPIMPADVFILKSWASSPALWPEEDEEDKEEEEPMEERIGKEQARLRKTRAEEEKEREESLAGKI